MENSCLINRTEWLFTIVMDSLLVIKGTGNPWFNIYSSTMVE